ncbi:MAG: hypothetical protein ACREO5_14530, partial [Candidatus Binatia bacterium]
VHHRQFGCGELPFPVSSKVKFPNKNALLSTTLQSRRRRVHSRPRPGKTAGARVVNSIGQFSTISDGLDLSTKLAYGKAIEVVPGRQSGT